MKQKGVDGSRNVGGWRTVADGMNFDAVVAVVDAVVAVDVAAAAAVGRGELDVIAKIAAVEPEHEPEPERIEKLELGKLEFEKG